MGLQVLARACSIETNRRWTPPRPCMESKGVHHSILGNLLFAERRFAALSGR